MRGPVLYGEAARKSRQDAIALFIVAALAFAGLLFAFLKHY